MEIPTKDRPDETSFAQMANKRQRSETSPDTQEHKRRLYDRNHDEPQKFDLTEDIILQLFDNLDKIDQIANKQESILNTENLSQIHTNLHKLVTMIVFKYGSLEKENIMIKNQLVTQDMIKQMDHIGKNINSEKIAGPIKKPYSDILQENNSKGDRLKEKARPSETVQWKTPPTVKRHEMVIRIDNISDPKETLKQIKSEIHTKDVGKRFKSIKQTKNGAVIIESFDEQQQEKLKNIIQKKENITIKESQSNNPMFMLTGINKGFSDSEFLIELETLNNEIVAELGYSISDKIKVITKKQCRNPRKENWILQASPNIAKWFLKKETVYFDLVKVYVEEYLILLCVLIVVVSITWLSIVKRNFAV